MHAAWLCSGQALILLKCPTNISRLKYAGMAPVEGQMSSRHGVMVYRQKVCLPEVEIHYIVMQLLPIL